MKRQLVRVLFLLTFTAALTAAHAQSPNPKLKPTPAKNLSVLLPDLVVKSVVIGKGSDGLIKSVRVTVANTCAAQASKSYVLVTFYDKAGDDGKALYYVGKEVNALKGNESFSELIEVTDKAVPANSHVVVEVDPYKTVKEDDETNNWSKLNPNTAPFPSNGQTHCKAKN